MIMKPYSAFLREAARYASKKEIEDMCFLAIIDSYHRVKYVKGIANFNENSIRDQFIIDLEKKNDIIKHALDNYLINIIPESYDALKKKRSDIRFILNIIQRNLIFECKKLKTAEERYLNDGLIRFIRLEYAENEDDAGMIGFIIHDTDFSPIIRKLKEKIRKFHFDTLIDGPLYEHPHSFQSVHIRIDHRKIKIGHFFFAFGKN